MKTLKAAAPANEVDRFMAELQHPLKSRIEAVRGLILAVSPAIREEIKWKSPGFRTTESFATVNLRATDQLQLILHLGAKVRPDLKEMKIADPAGLLQWLGKDRALATVGPDSKAFQKIIRAWIQYV